MTTRRDCTPVEELLTDDRTVPASTVDLRGALHRLGGVDGSRPPAVTPRRRIRIIQPDVWTPTGPRLTIHEAVDGIQALRVRVYRYWRPVMVAYASAACLETRGLKLTCLTQRLFGHRLLS